MKRERELMLGDIDKEQDRIQRLLGGLLITGVVSAAAIVLAGGIAYLIRYGATPRSFHIFSGEPSDLRHLDGIIVDAFSLKSRGIIQLGLLVLIATPIARVAFSLVAFLRDRDWIYTFFTLFVLLLLLYSLVGRQVF